MDFYFENEVLMVSSKGGSPNAVMGQVFQWKTHMMIGMLLDLGLVGLFMVLSAWGANPSQFYHFINGILW